MPAERNDEPASGSHWKTSIWRRFPPLLLVVGAMALVWLTGLYRHLTLEAVATNRDLLHHVIARHRTLALLAYVGVYIAIVGLSLPGATVLTLTGGLLFGWLIGALAAVVGATAGATIVFLVARRTLGDDLVTRAGPAFEKLRDGFKQDAVSYVLFLHLMPAFPFWLVNLAPAIFGAPIHTYVIGTIVGIVPGTLAIASVGAGLDAAISAAKAEKAGRLHSHTGRAGVHAVNQAERFDECSAFGGVGSAKRPRAAPRARSPSQARQRRMNLK